MADQEFDVLVIGCGLVGAAVAAHLSAERRVAVLEMEEQPGYHSTGRSAALYLETYGGPVIRALTRASRDLLFAPPPAFSEEPFVTPRQILIFGREEKREAFEAFVADELPAANLEEIDAATALAMCPVLRAEGLIGAVIDHASADIDVHRLQQAYLRLFRQRGGALVLDARVESLSYDADGGRWIAATPRGSFHAPQIINASGAWADGIAAMAGIAQIGLEPRRRTAALIEPPEGFDTGRWPLIVDAEQTFYMKPDAGLLLMSPADETLSDPEDAQPDELDVAIAADLVETYTTLQVRRIKSKWAGLRSFVADRNPVIGFDPDAPGFFWLAALGGYGIQTAPAIGEIAAKLVLGAATDADFAALGITLEDLAPARLGRTHSGTTR